MAGIHGSEPIFGDDGKAGLEGSDSCTVTNMVAEQGSSMDSLGLAGGGLFCVRDPDTNEITYPNVSQDVLLDQMVMGSMVEGDRYFIGDHDVDTGSGGELARDGIPDSSVLDVGLVGASVSLADAKNGALKPEHRVLVGVSC